MGEINLEVDSLSILFNHRYCQKPNLFPTWVLDGFLKRFGSLERMKMEGTPNKHVGLSLNGGGTLKEEVAFLLVSL